MGPFLPYGRQLIEPDDIAAVSQALQSEFLTTGPAVETFEAALRGATGADFAVSCSSGTAALHLASVALGLGPGDQVVVPSITFLATANAPHHTGAEVVFADVDPDTGLMTAETLAEALLRAPRAKAVFPVHLNGSWAPMEEISALARARGLFIVEDACHALGTDYQLSAAAGSLKGRVGDCRLSDLTCFSFHPVKAIAMGEGGAITAAKPELADRLRRLRNHGMTKIVAAFKNRDLAFDQGGRVAPWYYEMHEPGFNYRVPDVLCALGTSQLSKLDRFIKRRRHLARLYDDALAELFPIVRPAARPPNCTSAFHLYAVAIDFDRLRRSRVDLVDDLVKAGIGTQVHYVPVHRQPFYGAGQERTILPGADTYYQRALSLPLFPAMDDGDVDRVVSALRGAVSQGPGRAMAGAIGVTETLSGGIDSDRRSITEDSSYLAELIAQRPRILIFLPNTNELQRFVLAGAFADLGADHDLHFVVPASDRDKMRSAAPALLREDNTHDLEVSQERFAKWSQVFGLACSKLYGRSRSFAIRAGLGPDRRLKLGLENPLPGARGLAFRLVDRLSRATLIPIRPRRKLAAVASLLANSGPAFGKWHGNDVSSYNAGVERIILRMRPHEDIIALFDRLQPLAVVIPTSLLDLFCNDVLWACATEAVGCLVLQSGWDNVSSKGIMHHKPTLFGAWGRQSARHARAIQKVPLEQIISLGAPHYEFLVPASAADVAEMRRSLGVTGDERVVLFGGSFRQFDETWALRRLEAAIAEGRLPPMKVVYRPHPWRADRQDECDFFQFNWQHVVFDPDMRERYQIAKADRGYLKRNVPMYDMSYLARLLSSVDAVISPMSTLLLEALIMERPTMAVAFGDGKHAHDPSVTSQMTHFNEIRKSPAIVWCADSSLFEQDVIKLLTAQMKEQSERTRDCLLDEIVQRRPGTYAQRLSKACREQLEPVARRLRAKRAARKRGHISHAYGANLIARDYCGAHLTDPQIPGYWMHGWIPTYHNIHSALIALHKKEGQGAGHDYERQIAHEKNCIPQWVSRKDQADFLAANGYKHVRAIGLPMAYIDQPPVRRVAGSLLVMPPHSHKNHGPDDWLAETYAEMLADMSRNFSHVWVCLHEDDIAKREWIESFRRRGLGVFPSADQSDPHTLRRLHHILSSFEYVTTNGYGSHIAYAAYCGAKVSIWGPFAEFPLGRMTRTHAVKMFPELRDAAYELCTEPALKSEFPFLFTEPHRAALLKDWGAEQVGAPNRLAPADLAEAFGWSDQLSASARNNLVATTR